MKKYLWLLLPTLIACTVLLASTSKNANRVPGKTGTVSVTDPMHWFQKNGATLTYDDYLTREDEVDLSGCPDDGSIECRRAYRTDQLNDPANPSLGVKPAQVNSPQDIIYKVVP